ncbi:MAG: hypothetical protein P4L53_05340 [Candidatus Obscuribacterales bacterium]|nr:hypothetical protein [Candidatus Obscuribacterales bacterium]
MFDLSSMKLGALLGQANLVRPDDLKASVPMAKKMRLPIGRVLVSTGALSDELLEAALSAQSLIRERLVPAETAIKALKNVKEKGVSFAEALSEYGLKIEHLEFTNKLGQLLVDSEYVTSDQRHEALQVALGTGLPLGRVLVFKQLLSNATAYAALSAQVLIRASKISRGQAIEALKKSNNDHYSFEQALTDEGCGSVLGSQKVMLGQLLVASNLISEIDFLMGLEKSLGEENPLGKVLVELQMLSSEQVERALTFQKRVQENLISVDEAAAFLQQGKSDIPPAPKPVSPLPQPTLAPSMSAEVSASPPTPMPSMPPTPPQLSMPPHLVQVSAIPAEITVPAPPSLPAVPAPLPFHDKLEEDASMEAPTFAEPLNPTIFPTFNRPLPPAPEEATMRLARAVKQIPVVDPSIPFGILELLIFGRLISHAQADMIRTSARETGYREDYLLLEQELINVNTLKGVTQCLACYKDGSITAEEAVLAFYTWYSRPEEPVENVISLVTQRDFV